MRNKENGATKTVLVTGSSRGLGAIIAKQLAQRVIVSSWNYFFKWRKSNASCGRIGDDRAIAIKADVRDKQQVESMILEAAQQFGPHRSSC